MLTPPHSVALVAVLFCYEAMARAADELSLVQISAEARSEVPDDDDDDSSSLQERFFGSLLEVQHIPGVRGMREQLSQAAGLKMPPPEQGFHKKLLKALPVLQTECKTKDYVTEEDCNNSINMLSMMINVTQGPEPMWTWHGQLRMMMGLHFWLYTPGTMLCFSILDMDQSKGITWPEMQRLFGAQMMNGMSPMWKFLDLDNDGNLTRPELYKYLRAAILVREQLPALDPIDPAADTKKCLNMAHRVLAPPPVPPKKMKFYPKLLSIAGIVVGAVALHCLLCSGSNKKMSELEEEVEKAPEGKTA